MTQDANLTHDPGTLTKIYDAFRHNGIDDEKTTEVVNTMQNYGILFRERIPSEG